MLQIRGINARLSHTARPGQPYINLGRVKDTGGQLSLRVCWFIQFHVCGLWFEMHFEVVYPMLLLIVFKMHFEAVYTSSVLLIKYLINKQSTTQSTHTRREKKKKKLRKHFPGLSLYESCFLGLSHTRFCGRSQSVLGRIALPPHRCIKSQ